MVDGTRRYPRPTRMPLGASAPSAPADGAPGNGPRLESVEPAVGPVAEFGCVGPCASALAAASNVASNSAAPQRSGNMRVNFRRATGRLLAPRATACQRPNVGHFAANRARSASLWWVYRLDRPAPPAGVTRRRGLNGPSSPAIGASRELQPANKNSHRFPAPGEADGRLVVASDWSLLICRRGWPAGHADQLTFSRLLTRQLAGQQDGDLLLFLDHLAIAA